MSLNFTFFFQFYVQDNGIFLQVSTLKSYYWKRFVRYLYKAQIVKSEGLYKKKLKYISY